LLTRNCALLYQNQVKLYNTIILTDFYLEMEINGWYYGLYVFEELLLSFRLKLAEKLEPCVGIKMMKIIFVVALKYHNQTCNQAFLDSIEK